MKFDQIVKASSLVGGFLIFLGALYLHIYYYYFKIPIFRYIEISDILVQFFGPLLFNVLFFITVLVFFYVLFPLLVYLTAYCIKLYKKYVLRKPAKINNAKQSQDEPKWFVSANVVWLAIYSAICIISFLDFYTNNELYFDGRWILCVEIAVVAIFFQSIYRNIESMKIIYANVLLTFLFSTLHSATENIKEVRMGRDYYQETYFVTDHDTIRTDIYRHYIGKTSNYIYIYNNKDSSSEIYPSANIKEVFMCNMGKGFPSQVKDKIIDTVRKKDTLSK